MENGNWTMVIMLNKYLVVLVLVVVAGAWRGAASVARANGSAKANVTAPMAQAEATPSKSFMAAYVAKLKWIEGTWRGMDSEKPVFERYWFDDETAMVAKTFFDEALS